MKKNSLWLRILGFAKPETKTLLIATFFLVIASASSLVYPQAIRTMVDEALAAKNMAAIDKAALLILLIFSIQAVASSLRYFLFTMAGERIVLNLRSRLYGHILDQDISFFDFNKTGELMSRISNDTTIVQNAVSVNISMGLRNLASTIGGLALMAYTSPKLTLSMLLVIPPVAVGAAIFGKKIRQFSRNAQDTLADASVIAEETMSGVRTVHSFAQEAFEKNRYQQSLLRSLSAVRSKVFQITWFMTLASLLGYGSVAAIVWMGGREVIESHLTIGDLTQFLLYLLIVAFSVGSLGSLWGDFMSAVGAAKRIFEILDQAPLISLQTGKTLPTIEGAVEFRNVEFSYPARPDLKVLKNFSLKVNPSEIVALVGPSGSGKTTTAALLSRFYDPLQGQIFIDGVNIKELDPQWLRKQIGLVSQEPILISSTIEENIRYGHPQATNEEVLQAAKLANADEFIQKFPDKYKTLVGERGIQLSGGQKQRVAIARAILKNPKILILDEATSALDTESEALVQQALSHLMKGRTTLVIAHRLATIQGADIIFVIENGNIMESGSHQQLIQVQDGLYRRLIDRQLSR